MYIYIYIYFEGPDREIVLRAKRVGLQERRDQKIQKERSELFPSSFFLVTR